MPDWRERYGITAGVTGRGAGGVPFDLGLGTVQPVGEVMERWRAFRAAFPGFPSQVLSRQVHGTAVAWHDRLPAGWVLLEGFDGHATASAGTLLLVTVADCIPVYLAAPRHAARSRCCMPAGGASPARIVAAGVHAARGADRSGRRPSWSCMPASASPGPQLSGRA